MFPIFALKFILFVCFSWAYCVVYAFPAYYTSFATFFVFKYHPNVSDVSKMASSSSTLPASVDDHASSQM